MALIFAHPAYSSTGTVLVGQSVTFSVTVDGTAPFSYQWYKDGTSLAGATGATCSISSVQATDAGNYYAVVANSAGSVTSDYATLIVNTAPVVPSFTTQPVVVGASVTFTAASGTPAPTFQWQKNGVNLAGATSASYTIASVATGDAGSYTVVVTSSTDSVTSDVAVLTVSLPAVATAPIVITTPLTVSTLAGQALSDGSADGTGSGVRFFCPSGVAVDNAGNLCPLDSHNITFSVSGPGNYRGGSDNYVTVGKPLSYHSPLDPELRAEGGMCKVAVRSMFTPGTVTVSAASPGLDSGSTSFTVYSLDGTTQVRPIPHFAAEPPAGLKLQFAGTSVRYYVGCSCDVSIDILDAMGKIINRAFLPRQSAGWHNAPGVLKAGGLNINGVYFVRCTVTGENAVVKRTVVMR